MKNYSEVIQFLSARERLGIKLGLENIRLLLGKLGAPQKSFFCIHIAGTNGKGSVGAMLSAILRQAGIKTGLYTSPHLIDIKERIRIGERDISEAEIVATAGKVFPLAGPETTYFELLTVLAIQYFKEQEADIGIMEVGMGGRYDATNICRGDIAVITDISLDHTQYLGDTIEKIKDEKMAIIKPGARVVNAEEIGDNYKIYDSDFDGQKVRIGHYHNLELNLLGRHQARNCSLALAVVRDLIQKGYDIPKAAVYRGLSRVNWPARFQVVSRAPLVIIDGAHNPQAAQRLKETVSEYVDRKVILIIGVMADKDYRGIMEALIPVAGRIITVTPRNDRALSGEVLKGLATGIPVDYIPDIKDALDSLTGDTPALVTGSLYLAGEALQVLSVKTVKKEI